MFSGVADETILACYESMNPLQAIVCILWEIWNHITKNRFRTMDSSYQVQIKLRVNSQHPRMEPSAATGQNHTLFDLFLNPLSGSYFLSYMTSLQLHFEIPWVLCASLLYGVFFPVWWVGRLHSPLQSYLFCSIFLMQQTVLFPRTASLMCLDCTVLGIHAQIQKRVCVCPSVKCCVYLGGTFKAFHF